MIPVMVFVFIFQTLIYAPVCHWTWTTPGWLFQLGALDFAGMIMIEGFYVMAYSLIGGGPVHITSGMSALAFALALGHRHEKGTGKVVPFHKPHNVSYVVLGTSLIFFGWFGFNGGISSWSFLLERF